MQSSRPGRLNVGSSFGAGGLDERGDFLDSKNPQISVTLLQIAANLDGSRACPVTNFCYILLLLLQTAIFRNKGNGK